MRLFVISLLAALSTLTTVGAHGAENDALAVPIDKITALANQAEVLKLAQKLDGKIDLDEIFSREDLWMESDSKPTHFLNKSLQYYFEGIIQQPGSPIVELILMGSQGETLAAYPLPTDYWQGDESKFINVMADEQTFIDNMAWDESSQTISAQVSVPVKDASGEMFGVLTAGIEASIGALSILEAQ